MQFFFKKMLAVTEKIKKRRTIRQKLCGAFLFMKEVFRVLTKLLLFRDKIEAADISSRTNDSSRLCYRVTLCRHRYCIGLSGV